jgi:hypothetical protein
LKRFGWFRSEEVDDGVKRLDGMMAWINKLFR